MSAAFSLEMTLAAPSTATQPVSSDPPSTLEKGRIIQKKTRIIQKKARIKLIFMFSMIIGLVLGQNFTN